MGSCRAEGLDFMKAQLDEVCCKYNYWTAGAEQPIKDQLEQARRESYEAEIHKLKFELKEARSARINAVNRLIVANKKMASLKLKLDEANKKQQMQNSTVEQCEEAPTQSERSPRQA
ncbi:hypothetical protein VZT92_016826 [Zoarces viviparus]|uniref:Uncharacterized protein n=1 Tax=Zoarces viviparus TaxID=48416 RepID=A0AAW1EQ94_ZOAVI